MLESWLISSHEDRTGSRGCTSLHLSWFQLTQNNPPVLWLQHGHHSSFQHKLLLKSPPAKSKKTCPQTYVYLRSNKASSSHCVWYKYSNCNTTTCSVPKGFSVLLISKSAINISTINRTELTLKFMVWYNHVNCISYTQGNFNHKVISLAHKTTAF